MRVCWMSGCGSGVWVSSLHAYACVCAATRVRLCKSRIHFECGRARRGERLGHIWSSKLLQVGLRQMLSGAEESPRARQSTRSSPIITARARSSALALTFNSAVTSKMCSWGPICVCVCVWVSQRMYVIPGCGMIEALKVPCNVPSCRCCVLLTTLHISCDNKQMSSGSLRGWQHPAHTRCGFKLKVLPCVLRSPRCHNVHRD